MSEVGALLEQLIMSPAPMRLDLAKRLRGHFEATEAEVARLSSERDEARAAQSTAAAFNQNLLRDKNEALAEVARLTEALAAAEHISHDRWQRAEAAEQKLAAAEPVLKAMAAIRLDAVRIGSNVGMMSGVSELCKAELARRESGSVGERDVYADLAEAERSAMRWMKRAEAAEQKLAAAERVAAAAEAHLEQHRQEDPHELSRVRHELWQRDSECKALSEAKHTAEQKLAAAESNVTRITEERLTVERGWRAAEARVRELEADIERYSHGKLATRCEAAESELAQLKERVAKVKIAIGHTWTAEGMREAVEEALRGN